MLDLQLLVSTECSPNLVRAMGREQWPVSEAHGHQRHAYYVCVVRSLIGVPQQGDAGCIRLAHEDGGRHIGHRVVRLHVDVRGEISAEDAHLGGMADGLHPHARCDAKVVKALAIVGLPAPEHQAGQSGGDLRELEQLVLHGVDGVSGLDDDRESSPRFGEQDHERVRGVYGHGHRGEE
jgi:hypothetical protein